jgi:hypothetical protein
MSGAILPLPQYAFLAWCRDNFTVTFTGYGKFGLKSWVLEMFSIQPVQVISDHCDEGYYGSASYVVPHM